MAGYIGSKASVVSSGAEHKKLFNITTTTTSLTGLVYTPTLVHVFHNGVRLVDGTDYTATNGTSITLTVAAQNGDQVAVVSYATFQTSDTVSASAGGTFGNSVTMNSGAVVNRTGDGTIIDLQSGGTTVGSIGSKLGNLFIGSTNGSDGHLTFGSNIMFPANSNGDAKSDAIDLGAAWGRFKDLYLSGGVYLGGTGSANKLDDYEEGTFVPTLGGTTTYNGAAGFYTKVGQVVSVQCYVNIASLNTPKNGNHYIQGLPFAASGQESYMGVHYFYNCAVNMSYLAFRATGYDMWPTFAGSPSGSMGVNPAIFQNNTQVYIAGVYRTTQ